MGSNTITLDLANKDIADAFSGNRVGDECELENVRLKVKSLHMSHDEDYKDGKPTGKKKANGSITLEVQGFDYGDSSYDFSDGKEKSKSGGDAVPAEPPAPAYKSGGGSKAGLVVAVGLGKRK